MKVNGMQAVIVFLFVVAMFGSIHLLAASFPEKYLSRVWTGLGF